MKEIDERMVSETMSGVSVERDFLGIDSGGAAKKPIMERKKSFRELHGEISKMNPDVIKSVIATSSAAAVGKRKTPLPVLSSASRSKMETAPAVAPFTIFYNGAVVVFDLPREKAENILKLVEADKFGDLVHASKEPAVGEELDDDNNVDMMCVRGWWRNGHGKRQRRSRRT
ncbi:jasmonate-zim-domain protein 10 [Musa troglodytarum]|uniref:Jasmonate-zim-domain protein 10 n=1 Tax=Musa troglodytarum TaxID=320322 RepID=A0A9E7L394_9LILI|nr:jasmonate-zim-domain protein 10 [Musa troglodytarum]